MPHAPCPRPSCTPDCNALTSSTLPCLSPPQVVKTIQAVKGVQEVTVFSEKKAA